MEGLSLFTVCTGIVLLVSTITSICTLVNLIKKPAQSYRERQENDLIEKISDAIFTKLDEQLDKKITNILVKKLPELLKTHDLEVRDKYKADRERYLCEIKNEVLKDIKAELEQIKILKDEYNQLIISAKDVLREKIIKIYNDNRGTRTIPTLDRERLDQFYKDYKALKGNSYIDKYYKRTLKWQTLEDDYQDDDII